MAAVSAAAAANHVVLLEQYVESTMHIPSELQRLLGTIRNLDEKTNTISAEVKTDVARCMTLVPQSSWKGQGEQYREVAELRRRIEDRQRMLVQMGEEKVQLAIQGYALVDKHLAVISQHVKEQEEEEEAAGPSQEAPPVETGIIGLTSPTPSILPTPTTARRPPIATPRNSTGKQSEKKVGEKRVRDREKERENRLEREAQREAVAQAAAAQAAAAAAAGMAGTAPLSVNLPKKPSGSTLPAPGEYVVPDAIKNLQPSSLKPQAPGRLLTHADISQELKGRHAELFWPDDNLWYVITIHTINPMAKSADIMYTTGETEQLDLNEIVREGHMSLMQIPA